jgi:branched-chain amino acid transport system ATP-binding protein
MTDEPLLQVNGVHSGYGDLTVVRDVSFAVAKSSICVLLGRNGAGKTTLLRTIAGLNETRSGSVVFRGNPIQRLPPYKRSLAGIGLVQENKRTFKKLTVEQNLRFGAFSIKLKRAELAERLTEAYDRFPILGDKRNQLAGYLSGGQQQMLGIGQALMSRPELLMLDEPFSGLAPSIVSEVMETVRKIRSEEGRTLLVVEQAVDLALEMADTVLIIDVGRLVHEGPADQPGMRETVQGVYFGSRAG